MAKEKAPAFQFYAKDFISDGNVAGMSMQERGVYITLICVCWQEGSLPSDLGRLSNMTGLPLAQFRRLWTHVVPCFRATDDGRFIHPRLEIERDKQEQYRRRASDRGAKGARGRWQQGAQTDALSMPQACVNDGSNDGSKGDKPSTNDGSPISDLQRSPKPPQGGSVITTEALATKAASFLSVFSEIYARVRGAASPVREARDHPKAIEIVSKWPDLARLSLMVEVFLKLEKEKMNHPGSIGQFAYMAPECDHLLAVNGR